MGAEGSSFYKARSARRSAPARARTLLRTALDFIAPAFCVQCGEPVAGGDQAFFCGPCWARWPAVEAGACRGCGRPREQQIGYAPGGDFYCADCSGGRRPLRHIYAAARYEGVAGEAVRAFKYRRWDTLAEVLGPKLIEMARRRVDLAAYAAVVPVPLHWRRAWWRGFNQAGLLADQLAGEPLAPPVARLLRRTRYTTPQSRLEGRARRHNLRDAFALRRGATVEAAAYLLVDDVTTTGTTLAECARVLRRAGASEVDAVTVAVTGTVAK